MAASVREGCVYIRVETAATGWALSAEGQALVRAAAWIHLQLDAHGLSGVVAGGDDWAQRIGAVTHTLGELTAAQVRHDVVLVTLPPEDARELALTPDVIAVFGTALTWSLVVDPRAVSRLT